MKTTANNGYILLAISLIILFTKMLNILLAISLLILLIKMLAILLASSLVMLTSLEPNKIIEDISPELLAKITTSSEWKRLGMKRNETMSLEDFKNWYGAINRM